MTDFSLPLSSVRGSVESLIRNSQKFFQNTKFSLIFFGVLAYTIIGGGRARCYGLPHLFIGTIAYKIFSPFVELAILGVVSRTVLSLS